MSCTSMTGSEQFAQLVSGAKNQQFAGWIEPAGKSYGDIVTDEMTVATGKVAGLALNGMCDR